MENLTNDYDVLESQIGREGSEPMSLGTLRRIPGQQEELTESEKSSMEDFLKRSESAHAKRFGDTRESEGNDIASGWIPIDRSELGLRDMFYPEDWEFRIRPAEVEAIKNWSSIDENNIAVTNSVFNEIMKACVSIKTPAGKLPWGKINTWDRFWFLIKAREYTFAKGEAALNYDEDCPECGAQVFFDLKPENLVYEFPDEEVVKKHWNQEERAWIIDPTEYDIDMPVQYLYVPTLEKDEAILQWAYAQAQMNKQISEPLLRFLPWMLKKSSKDPDTMDKMVREVKREFNSWDTDMFNFMDEVLRNIVINPSEKLKQICPNCGEEVQASVRFPNGIRSLFAVQNKHRKFGTK